MNRRHHPPAWRRPGAASPDALDALRAVAADLEAWALDRDAAGDDLRGISFRRCADTLRAAARELERVR